MSATKIGAVADAIKDAIDAAAITSRGNALKVYSYDPGAASLDSLPAVSIEGPTSIERTPPDRGESQLGSDDWQMTFMVRLFVANDRIEDATSDMRSLLGQLIAAIDADRDLGGEAEIDAGIVSGELSYTTEESQRQMLVYETALSVWALV